MNTFKTKKDEIHFEVLNNLAKANVETKMMFF